MLRAERMRMNLVKRVKADTIAGSSTEPECRYVHARAKRLSGGAGETRDRSVKSRKGVLDRLCSGFVF